MDGNKTQLTVRRNRLLKPVEVFLDLSSLGVPSKLFIRDILELRSWSDSGAMCEFVKPAGDTLEIAVFLKDASASRIKIQWENDSLKAVVEGQLSFEFTQTPMELSVYYQDCREILRLHSK